MARVRLALVMSCLFAFGACGGNGGEDNGGPNLDDLTGKWIFSPSSSGVTGGDLHLTVTQTGSNLDLRVTCNDSAPVGSGTWSGEVLSVSFEIGEGAALTLEGQADGRDIIGAYSAPGETGTFTLSRTSQDLDCDQVCEELALPKFVNTNFTELEKIAEISLFRSSAGHDYSDFCESCRSMKHYFAPAEPHRVNGDVEVYSPVAGTILEIRDAGHGASEGNENKEVRIQAAQYPEISFILFHIDIEEGVTEGQTVQAGELIGTGRLVYPDLGEVAHDFDIAVRYHTLSGDRFVSWFEVITDELFESYQERGASARTDFILTAEARDADPLACDGETFTSSGSLPAWFELNAP